MLVCRHTSDSPLAVYTAFPLHGCAYCSQVLLSLSWYADAGSKGCQCTDRDNESLS